MNKIFKLFVFISALFVVVGLTSCSPTVNINSPDSGGAAVFEIVTSSDLKTFMTNSTTTGKLMANISIDETVNLSNGKEKILDFNGKTITSGVQGQGSEAAYAFKVSGANTKLTIKETAQNAQNDSLVANSSADAAVYVDEGAKFINDGVTILAKKEGAYAVYIDSTDSEFEMKGGKVCAANDSGGVTKTGCAVLVNRGKAQFTDGTLYGKIGIAVGANGNVTKISGIHLYASEIGINNGGKIGIATETDSGIISGTFQVKAERSNFIVKGIVNWGSTAYIKMSGGTFNLTKESNRSSVYYRSIDSQAGGTGTISGGTFNTYTGDDRITTGITIGSAVTFSVSN